MSLFRRGENFTDPAQPTARRGPFSFGTSRDTSGNELFGKWTEGIARGMGTPWFLLVLTLFCAMWLTWNVLGPEEWRFASAA